MMKYTLTLLASLLLAPLAPLHAVQPTSAASLPTRPPYPVKMDALSDAEFGWMFFSEIDLAHADMAKVKPLVEKGDYVGALAAWREVFVRRCRSLPLVPWLRVNHYPVELLMKPDRVLMQHGGVVKDFGPVGQMDWYGLKDWCLHVNMMWHPGALVRAVEQNAAAARGDGKPSQFANEALLARWRDIWRDYVNNNWRIGMPLTYDAKVREAALAKAGLISAPSEWASAVGFKQQLVLEWPVCNWFTDVEHASRAAPEDFDRVVPARALAEMTYFMVVWPLDNLQDGGKLTPEQLCGGAPNQNQEKMSQFMRLGLLAPEFHRAAKLRRITDEAIKIIIGAPGWQRAMTDRQADGSGTELSFNYMKALAEKGEEWLTTATAYAEPADWLPLVREAVEQRRKFMANLETPTGLQVLCKGIHQRAASLPTPHDGYTSIAFPYHGLYMMRSDWTHDALFLSLHNPRRGQGHEANDGNKLMLEAYGRYMLVANGGELKWSERNQCSVNVDGFGTARTAAPKHGAFAEPMSGRWLSSAAFDFAESTYTYGYGALPHPRPDGPWARVTDVQHQRQAIFVKEAKLWFVVDTMLAPETASHRYQQVWPFHHDFPKDSITIDESKGTISTRDSGKPNLFLYQSSPAVLAYERHHGEGNTSGKKDVSLEQLPETALGWHNTGSGDIEGSVLPAVTVHCTWEGTGRQTVLTALVPSKDAESTVASFKRIAEPDRTGLVLALKDGSTVHCLVSTTDEPFVLEGANVHAAVWTERPGAATRGLSLGAPNTTGNEFTEHDSHRETVATIRVPTGFRWTMANGVEVPAYFAP